MKGKPSGHRRPPLPVQPVETNPDEIREAARKAFGPALAKVITEAIQRGIEQGELVVEDGVVRVNHKG